MQVGVFHPGTQHSRQTALALQQLGRLEWLATSIFYRPDRVPYALERWVPGAPGRRLKAEFRRFSHPSLDPTLVRTAGLSEWVERLATRAGMARAAQWIDAWGNDRFAKSVEQALTASDPIALWGFNGSSRRVFEFARRHGHPCILDRTNGDFRIYNAMMAEVSQTYCEWFFPTERSVPAETIDKDRQEYALADKIVVGSPFAADTIRQAEQSAVIDAKLEVLNYCYDEALFGSQPPPREVPRDRPVRFLWVGLVIPRKGIQHVLEAISRIPRSAAELTIVGGLGIPRSVFARFADRVTYIPTVARSDVPQIMAEHDVFLLPSYFEGAGITLYEALASGNALIQTSRCAPAVTPQTGILLERPDSELVHQAMMEAIDDRFRLNEWRAAAQPEARNYTFARYRQNIANLLETMGI